ncbi:MAG TPA: malectin domain-containing carbohydrate-binding protein [Terriglobales bacterium]|jgi:hypothetical protein|nr:malectin domain-containing carbohydrate-binding protein [Terriglobales bacterium]
MYKDSSQSGNHTEEAHQDYKNEHPNTGLSATHKLNHQPSTATSHWTKDQTVSGLDEITSSNAEILGRPTNQEERAELAAVLATETFKRSPKLSRLLSYLCDKYFIGEGNELKEYSIAVDVLGRDSEFDPQLDAAVRVDTHYLRKRLKDYYAREAYDHRVQIVIPKGQYIPQFLLRPESGMSPQLQPTEEDEEEVTDKSLREAGDRSRERPATQMPNRRWLAIGLAAATVSALLWMTIARPWQHPAKNENKVQNGTIGAAASHVNVARNTEVPPASLTAESGAIRILAGDRNANYVDKAGRVWLSDRYFRGGTTFNHGPREIVRTEDPDIFRSGREGQFAYEIPLTPGTYELHIYFAETQVNGEGLRTVSLSINELPVSTLDVASDAGGANIATEKIFKNISPAKDGLLHLTFQGSGPAGFVNALEIVPGAPGKMLPVRLTMQDSSYRDHLGQIWMPDQYFLSGRRSTVKAPIEGTADPALYATHRFGNFTYSIPVAEGGRYTVTLHFAETWFSSPESLGGVGSRVFDVYCNGRTLLKDFDILKESGGAGNRAVVKVFHNIPASAQGKLNLTFVPTVNYALVSAIEVTEE